MQIRCPYCGNSFDSPASEVAPYCPHCGQRIDLSSQPGGVPPAGGLPPQGGMGSEGEPTPWERRSEQGLVQGFLETWKSVMFNPDRFWNSTSPQGSLWDGLSFAWLTFAISTLVSLPFQFLLGSGQFQQVFDQMHKQGQMTPEMERVMTALFTGGGLVLLSVGVLVLYPLGFIISTGITHLMCLMLGMSQNGYNATARAYGYAAAPSIFAWVPYVGAFASTIYSLVLYVWGLARMQRASYGRAAVAVLGPVVLLFCCCCGLLAFVAMSAAAAIGRH